MVSELLARGNVQEGRHAAAALVDIQRLPTNTIYLRTTLDPPAPRLDGAQRLLGLRSNASRLSI